MTQKLFKSTFKIINFVFKTRFDATHNLDLLLPCVLFCLINILRLKHCTQIRRSHSLCESSKEFVYIIKVIGLLLFLVVFNGRSYIVDIFFALVIGRKYLAANFIDWRCFRIVL